MAKSPFKMRGFSGFGNSPVKQTKDWLNVKGYLKGEQGLIPNISGESTLSTASKVSKGVQEFFSKRQRSGMSRKGYDLHMKEKRKQDVLNKGDESLWTKVKRFHGFGG